MGGAVPHVGQPCAARTLTFAAALATELRGADGSLPPAGGIVAGGFTSDCSIRLHLLEEFGLLVQRLSRETHPLVERCGALVATTAGLDPQRVGDALDDI